LSLARPVDGVTPLLAHSLILEDIFAADVQKDILEKFNSSENAGDRRQRSAGFCISEEMLSIA
jgi:hypothetical protein